MAIICNSVELYESFTKRCHSSLIRYGGADWQGQSFRVTNVAKGEWSSGREDAMDRESYGVVMLYKNVHQRGIPKVLVAKERVDGVATLVKSKAKESPNVDSPLNWADSILDLSAKLTQNPPDTISRDGKITYKLVSERDDAASGRNGSVLQYVNEYGEVLHLPLTLFRSWL